MSDSPYDHPHMPSVPSGRQFFVLTEYHDARDGSHEVSVSEPFSTRSLACFSGRDQFIALQTESSSTTSGKVLVTDGDGVIIKFFSL